jgi:peptidoglycan/LPS O-acetylase OafA/YrhL
MSYLPKIQDLEYSIALALPFVAIILAAAYAASAVVLVTSRTARSEVLPQHLRYGCLDGLRGLLALGVLIHHAFTAYGYFLRGQWTWSSSPLFNHLGQSTVALFFMITGYLFSKRLLGSIAYDGSVGWFRLYVSRIVRLVPLYAMVVSAVIISVFVLDFSLHESLMIVGRELASWYLFVIPGRPDINQMTDTWTLIAGVNWSLKYEWYFYACLPILYWPLRSCAGPTGTRVAVLGLACLLLIGVLRRRDVVETTLYGLHFACGIVAALIYEDQQFRDVISSGVFRIVAVLAFMGMGVLLNSHSAIAVGLTFILFLAALGGFSIGGLLRLRATLWLGEISYGIYLLHGLAIWWALHFLKNRGILSELNLMEYTGILAVITVAIVALASASYIYLEKPLMIWWKQSAVGGSISERNVALARS